MKMNRKPAPKGKHHSISRDSDVGREIEKLAKAQGKTFEEQINELWSVLAEKAFEDGGIEIAGRWFPIGPARN